MLNQNSLARISVFGDSILKGVLYQDGKYEVNRRWQQSFSEDFGIPVENHSRFGNTIQKMMPTLRRICGEPATEPEVALLELGGNDCDYNWGAIAEAPEGMYHCKTAPEQFVASYREAVSLLRQSGREPVALTLPPILSERYLDFICSKGPSREKILEWLGDVNEISLWQRTYSTLVRLVAKEEQVRLIDLQRCFPRDPRDLERLIGPDGIHPSPIGQQLIYDVLCGEARKALASV